ncbi:MAG: response regulator [Desulfobacterales bacterium]|nr:response regulator [Desulfobacterales bacterium]
MNKPVILCVDDELSILSSLRDQLIYYLGNAYNIEIAESAEEALELLEELSCDKIDVPIIISDQIMPGMKGDELLIKIHSNYPKSLKIFLTGQATAQAVGNVVNNANLHGYIAKPWDESNLQLTINKALHAYFMDKQINAQKEMMENLYAQAQNEIEKRKKMEKLLEQNNQNLEQKVKDRTLELEKANKAKSEFFANISHELRTPMNTIIGLTELILKTSLNVKQLDYFTKIKSSSNALLEIINNILDFSKIEAGRLELEYIDFNINSLLEEIVSILSVNANGKGINLILNPIDKNIGILKGDPFRLKQILMNLISNAIKFTEKGIVSIYMHQIEKKEDSISIKFEIHDTGIGIPKEKIPILFDTFTQVDSSTTRKYGGTGLGLAISKRLVEMMSGNITIKSEINKGSIFTFTAKFGLGDTKKEIEKQKNDELNLNMGFPEAKILLVEDNSFNRFVAREIINNMGAKIFEAVSGQEAINILLKSKEDTPYDVVLMDVQMPEMDGFEATQKIRKEERFKKLPIIAMTAYALKGDREKCIEAGMNDYLTKPIDVKLLFDVLSKWIKPTQIKNSNLQIKKLDSENILPKNYQSLSFDIKAGLQKTLYDFSLYKRLLELFQSSNNNSVNRLRIFINDGKIEEAKRIAHTLKGNAGMIGATKISTISAQIENILRNGIKEFDENLKELVNKLELGLNEVIDSISDYLKLF